METKTLPRTFVWRRLHSLFGLWLVLFLCEHLLANSQAALLIGNDGNGFVRAANALHNLPYLQVVEVVLLGIPILFHGVIGVKYLWTSKINSYNTDGSKPAMREYSRNHAFTWQRITSWVLLFLLIFHVVRFRFLEYPHQVPQGKSSVYLVKVKMDNGLYTVAQRLGVTLYSSLEVQREFDALQSRQAEISLVEAAQTIKSNDQNPNELDSDKGTILISAQNYLQKEAFVNGLKKFTLKDGEVIASAENYGTVTLLTVRDTFKNPIYVILYTIFVLAACFHGFNGFWTFLITWGVILSMAAQKKMVKFATGLMILVTFLGLAAIWGTYWLNLKY